MIRLLLAFVVAMPPLVASAQTLYVPSGTIGNTVSGNTNVGIGTDAPNGKLEIKAAASINFLQLTNSSNSDRYSRWGHDNEGAFVQVGNNGDSISLRSSSGSSLVYLNPSTGNLGIGTSSPLSRFHVVVNGLGEIATLAPGAATGIADFGTGGAGWTFSRPDDGSFTSAIYSYDSVGNTKNNMALSSRSDIVFTAGNSGPSAAPERMRICEDGNVGIGTASPAHKLAVNGTVRAKEVIVDTGWSDFVFESGYRLAPLSEVESHIREWRHLPDIPSAAHVESNGVSIGEMQKLLLQKIEELTLHLIAQEKAMNLLRSEVKSLRGEKTQP